MPAFRDPLHVGADRILVAADGLGDFPVLITAGPQECDLSAAGGLDVSQDLRRAASELLSGPLAGRRRLFPPRLGWRSWLGSSFAHLVHSPIQQQCVCRFSAATDHRQDGGLGRLGQLRPRLDDNQQIRVKGTVLCGGRVVFCVTGRVNCCFRRVFRIRFESSTAHLVA